MIIAIESRSKFRRTKNSHVQHNANSRRLSAPEDAEVAAAWRAATAFGSTELDREHCQFVARLTLLNQSIGSGAAKPAVQHLLGLVCSEAADHFRNEETMLDKWKYPHRTIHAAKHFELKRKMHELMADIDRADISFVCVIEALRIERLLIEHLLCDDTMYRDFVANRAHTGR